ncbi:MAG: cyclic 2,3-diphosphoglycerate synthase [Gaiellales bacterium]|jgi:cyclic 2,3-diphosphoglycerate synthetase|nr:cyclic 2,3-diphosphoglycerate synthase [Gaiellales bacterium]
MRARVLALVDGEHYPPVVRAALERAGEGADVVAALLLGGSEKLDGEPDYGVPLERVDGETAEAMLEVAARHGADRVLDLSDEPVLTEARRFWLASNALAAGLVYEGPDFELRPPDRSPLSVPALEIVGTGKRVGKTSVSAHTARLLDSRGHRVVVIAMGRGGPAEPEVVAATDRRVGVDELLRRARAGEHAASDFLEDAVLAGVTTVGARRCGGGLAGGTYQSNVVAAARLAEELSPGLLLVEGSGAAMPPLRSDRTVLVTSAARPADLLRTGLGPVRVLGADLVVMTMCEHGHDETRAAIEAVAPGTPTIATVLRPEPAEPLGDAPVAYFTTAPADAAVKLAAGLDANVTAVVPVLSDRAALREALETPEVRAAETYLVEIKAAAIDVVAEAAVERGARVVFCDNRPVALPGERDLDDALLELADEAVGARAETP